MLNNRDQQPSKGSLKYYQKGDKKCMNCEELSKQVKILADTMQQQNNTIIEILSEHKVLLLQIISQNKVVDEIIEIFPIKTEKKLSELNSLMQTQADPYVRRMKSLLKRNVGRYLNEILHQNLIHEFNVDGTHGKQSLKRFDNFYSAIIEVIADFADEPETTLRKAFQLQKKKIFKSNRVQKNKELVSTRNEMTTSQKTDLAANENITLN